MIQEEKMKRSKSQSGFYDSVNDVDGKTCSDFVAPVMIHPESKWILIWNEIISVFYIISFFLDPMVIVFAFEFLQYKSVRVLLVMSSTLFVLDMIVNLFTASINEQDVILDDETAKRLDRCASISGRNSTKSLIGRSYDLLILEAQQKKLRKGLDDQKLNRDFCFNLKIYLKTTLVFDIISNSPYFIYLEFSTMGWEEL